MPAAMTTPRYVSPVSPARVWLVLSLCVAATVAACSDDTPANGVVAGTSAPAVPSSPSPTSPPQATSPTPATGSPPPTPTPVQDDSAPSSAAEGDPIALAYGALERADYDSIGGHIERLEAAFEADPSASRVAFYAGCMYLWRATGAPVPPAQQLNDVLTAIERFEAAIEINPQDPQANAFLGITQMALGNTLGDQVRIETGDSVLEAAVPLYAPYIHGVWIQARGLLPPDHALFPKALDSIRGLISECGFGQWDGVSALPEVFYPTGDNGPVPNTCWDNGVVAHVWEGEMLIVGDVMAKRGDAVGALYFYEAAKLSPDYDKWPFRDELEARIADVDARVALYTDADRFNDPPTRMDQHNHCTGCHATEQ